MCFDKNGNRVFFFGIRFDDRVFGVMTDRAHFEAALLGMESSHVWRFPPLHPSHIGRMVDGALSKGEDPRGMHLEDRRSGQRLDFVLLSQGELFDDMWREAEPVWEEQQHTVQQIIPAELLAA